VLNLLKTRLTPKRKLDRQGYGQPFTAVYCRLLAVLVQTPKKKILTKRKNDSLDRLGYETAEVVPGQYDLNGRLLLSRTRFPGT
jgi:hypothetical protein